MRLSRASAAVACTLAAEYGWRRPILWPVLDRVELVTGRRSPLTPPRRLQFVGGGDYARVGRHFRELFVDIGRLEPHHDVLDVGCGTGRIAASLVDYVAGRYEGFDIVPEGIAWCQSRITPRHPNFNFSLADLYNSKYNRKGRFTAAEYTFPYADDSFDFAFLTSVFTHLLPHEVDNYVAELSRVLRPGGTCFATFFLLNHESEGLIEAGRSAFAFAHTRAGCRVDHPTIPEAAVALPEDAVRARFASTGMETAVHAGTWAGRDDGLSFQDVVIATHR